MKIQLKWERARIWLWDAA